MTTTRTEACLVKTKYSQCRNETNGALTVHLQPVGRPYGSLYSSSMVCRKAAWFIYGPSAGHTVHLRPVGRPYGSSTAYQKAVRLILRTISRTHGQLGAPFRRQPRRYLRRDSLRISFIFYGFIFMYFFYIL